MSTSPSSPQESQQAATTPRYWCYTCNAEVPIYMAPDPTCQHCNEQFIEEIDSENDPRTFLAGAPAANAADGGSNERTGDIDPATSTAFFRYETGDDDGIFHFFTPMGARNGGEGEGGGVGVGDEPSNLDQQPLAAMLQNLLTSMLGPAAEGLQQQQQQPQQQQGPGGAGDSTAGERRDEESEGARAQSEQQPRRRPPVVFYSNMVDGQFRPLNMNPQRNDSGEGEEGQEGRGDENRSPNNFASLLQLLSTLAGTPIDAGFFGNPDDYVFSQTALDNIISQLMEQTSGRNAPPPAPEAIIDSLPKRSLTDEEIARQADCAVCKDEFERTEQVVELPCAHVFHDDCIKPWLKVNGTCPVCRHSVVGDKQDSSNADNAGNNNNNNPSSSAQREPSGQSGQSSSNTQQEAPPPSSSSTQGSNSNNSQGPDTTSTISSLLFEGARRIYNDRSPSSAWHTTIPGPFTWGPGGRTTNNPTSSNNNNTSSTSNSSSSNNNNSNTQQQSSADPNNTDPMDLDLD